MSRLKTLAGIMLILVIAVMASCAKSPDKMTAGELLDLGEKYLSESNYERAAECFEKLTGIEPKGRSGYIGR
jgi:outer membrane protein assembly factor BamD (BamD/ComL family)